MLRNTWALGFALLAAGCESLSAGGDGGVGGASDVSPSDASGGTAGGAMASDVQTGGEPNPDLDAELATDAGPGTDSGPDTDALPGPDAAGPPPAPMAYASVPAAAELTLTAGDRSVLPGTASTDPTDNHANLAGMQGAAEVAAADVHGDLAIAALWSDDAQWYFIDGRYNASNFPVAQGTLSGLGGVDLPAYTLEPAQTAATDFLGTEHAVLYRFPEIADWRVYELADGVLRPVAEVASRAVVTDGYTRLPGVNANTVRARTLVFAHADRRLSTFTEVGQGAEAARLSDGPAGAVVQVHIPLPGGPHDTVDDARGPSAWGNIYGVNRIFHPVQRDAGPGVVWQDATSLSVYVTWLSDTLAGDFSTLELPGAPDGRLAGAFSEADGKITLLLVGGGDGTVNETARLVVVIKAAADGSELRRQALDAGPNALNVAAFEPDGNSRQNHAVMQRSGNRIGVLLARTIHISPDGLHHQSGGAFLLDAETLARVGDVPQTSGHSWGSVLQPAAPGEFLLADLGDNYPRGVHLHRFSDAGLRSRIVFTLKTLHGDQALTPAGETFPVYEEASGDGKTFYQWSNDNKTYTELAGIAQTPAGIVSVFSTERSLLDNSKVGADWNETRELAMVRVRSDFEAASAGRGQHWVTDDLVRSMGEPAVEGEFYSFNGGESPQRVAGVVFLTALGADESASRPKLHRTTDGLFAMYEVWRTVAAADGNGFIDTYVDTRALRLGEDGLPVPNQAANLGRSVRLANRDDPFALAGGTAVVEGRGAARRLVLTVVLPPVAGR